MPASRIAFAIGDLMSEIKALLPRDAEIDAELWLDPPEYKRLLTELENHYGQKMPAVYTRPNDRLVPYGESIKIGGLIIVNRASVSAEQADA